MLNLRRLLYVLCIVLFVVLISFSVRAKSEDLIKLASPPLPQKALEGLSITDIANLEAGKIVVLKQDSGEGKNKQSLIKASLVFNQPIDRVWDLLKQTDRQKEYLPHLKDAQIIEANSKGNITQFMLKIMFFNIRYRVDHKFENSKFRLTWHLDPDYKNDLKELYGYYQLYKIDDTHTLARYGSKVDIGLLVPTFIEDSLTRKDLPTALGNVKKWIDSDGKFRKNE
ncbi:MAG: hypothetical protein ACP5JP_04330 [bacterium]